MSETQDYRDLLVRYIRHVGESEGMDFLEYRTEILSDPEWTDAEWSTLQQLRDQAGG